MRYSDIIRTANANLRRSKLRTFLTSSAVFMGALTLMLTSGVGYGLKAYVEEQVNAAGAKDALIIMVKTENSGPASNSEAIEYNPDKKANTGDFAAMPTISADKIAEIGKEPDIQEIYPLYGLAVEYITTGDKKYQANVTQGFDSLNVPLKAGRQVNAKGEAYEITIAPAFVSALGFGSEQEAVGKKMDMAFKDVQGQLFILPVTIVGVQEKTLIQGNAMTVSISLARDAYLKSTEGIPDFQRYQYSAAVAKYDTSISDQQLKDLQQRLGDKGYNAQTLEDQLGVINSVIGGITTFLNLFAAIALAAASFGIVNTLLMAVQERTREIGLMKALGMNRRKIFMLFSLEAILIGFWSGLAALLAANILGRVGSNVASSTILKDFEGLELFSFPASSMISVILLVMLIAFLAATLPARRASRLNPIEALRYE